jgi:hypothetical protein
LNEQFGFDIENDDRVATQGLNVNRVNAGGTFSSLFINRQNGSIGLGTTTPRSPLEVQTYTGGQRTVLTLTNNAGGQGTTASLDFNTYGTKTNPSSRIEAYDEGNASNSIRFLVNTPPAQNSGLVERFKIGSDGSIFVNGRKPFMTKIYTSYLNATTQDIQTGVSSAEYTAIVAGFTGSFDPATNGVAALPQVHNGQWIISCSATGSNQAWNVFALFIRNEMIDIEGYFGV